MPQPRSGARAWARELPREYVLLAAAVLLAIVVRVVVVIAISRHQALAGDQLDYDAEARFIANGHWFWTTLPFGIPHASAWKAPGYPAFVGILYSIFGPHSARVELVQALVLSPLNVVLGWVLARRLFGSRVAIVAAFVLALYPNVWQFDVLLYSEALATTLILAFLIVVLERPLTVGRAAGAGALLGLELLVRPSSILLVAPLAVAWLLAAGWKRGALMTVLSVAVAALVVAPWTIRNAVVLHGFVPISIQDAAAYGTFNDDSANDPVFPYAWRYSDRRDLDLLRPAHPLSDVEWRSALQKRARDYVKDHPFSAVEAFYWNGLTRLWDVRRPSHVLNEVKFEGRSRGLTIVGLAAYYVLLPLALWALWRQRRRRTLVWPVLALALAASVVFTVDSGTRYRAPIEPLIVILACSHLALARRARATTS